MVAKTPLGSARIPPASECSCLLQTEQVDRRFIGPSLAQEGTQNIGHLQIRLLSTSPWKHVAWNTGIRKNVSTQLKIRLLTF